VLSKDLKPLFLLYQSLKVSLKASITLLEISSLKEETLMCLELRKIVLVGIL